MGKGAFSWMKIWKKCQKREKKGLESIVLNNTAINPMSRNKNEKNIFMEKIYLPYGLFFTKNGHDMVKWKIQNWRLSYPAFFFPCKKKSCPWKPFSAFLSIFSRAIFFFTGTFLSFFKIFHAQLFFFTGNFMVFDGFFTGKKSLSRAKIWFFSTGYFYLSQFLFFYG